MAQVLHTVKWTYGSYEGQTTVLCDEDASPDTIEAKVRRKEGLNFLVMASCYFEIVSTKRYDEE